MDVINVDGYTYYKGRCVRCGGFDFKHNSDCVFFYKEPLELEEGEDSCALQKNNWINTMNEEEFKRGDLVVHDGRDSYFKGYFLNYIKKLPWTCENGVYHDVKYSCNVQQEGTGTVFVKAVSQLKLIERNK